MRTAYNRYQGNTGRVVKIPDAEPEFQRTGTPVSNGMPAPTMQTTQDTGAANPSTAEERRPLSPLSGLSGEFERLIRRLSPMELETEDFLLILILYLLYRESGDEEFLLAIGGLLLF